MKKLLILAVLLCPLAHAATIACVTTPGTYTWSAGASWIGGVVPGSGDRATCGTSGVNVIVSTNTTVGDSPAAGTNVVTFSGGAVLAVDTAITFTVQGGVSVTGAGSIQGSADGVLRFESASAASPTSTPYTLTAVNFTTNGTNPATPTHRFTITADTVSGTNFRMANGTAGSGTSGIVNMLIQYCGDPAGAAQCFPYTPGGAHGTLAVGGTGTPVIFDHTCGVKWGTGYTSADSWNFKAVSFENTYSACTPWTAETGFNIPSGTRLFDGVVFDLAPSIEDVGATYTNSIFLSGYIDPLIFPGGGYGTISNSLIVSNWQNGVLTWAPNNGLVINSLTLTNDVIIGDPTTTIVSGVPTAPTALTTGTATSATSGSLTSTLTDSTKTFTTNQYATTGTVTFTIVISGGTGKGQARIVASNTATVITTVENWKTLPDTSSTYAIYKGPTNVHWTNGQSLVVGFSEPAYTGNIFQLVTDADNNGDVFHAINAIQGATCNLWRGAWSNAIAYAQFSSVSESGVYYRSLSATTGNDPATDGGVHWAVASTLAGMFSGCGVHEMDYNIVLANVADDNSGTFLTGGNAGYIGKHNSYFTGAQSAAFDESRPAAYPGQFISWQDNEAWAESRTYVVGGGSSLVASGIGPFVLQNTGGSSTAIYIDAGALTCFTGGTSSCLDYNGETFLLATGFCASPSGDNQGGSTAYQIVCTKPVGSHDIVGNPGFRVPFPSAAKWLQTLGIDTSLSDPMIITPDVYTCLMKINDVSGFNPSCTITSLYTYEHQAMDFTNVAFHNAGADSLDIGAGQYIPPAAGTNASCSGNCSISGNAVIQ